MEPRLAKSAIRLSDHRSLAITDATPATSAGLDHHVPSFPSEPFPLFDIVILNQHFRTSVYFRSERG